MLHKGHTNHPRVGGRNGGGGGGISPHPQDVSFLSSTSAPLSTSPNITTATSASNHNPHHHSPTQPQQQQQREAHLRYVLQHTAPSPAELSAVATGAYVQALMELIDQHGSDVERLTSKIDALQAQREAYYAEVVQAAQQRDGELHELKSERSDLVLQVQEERERSTRLLHENTVLYTQQAEQREQLARLADLCRSRGRRLLRTQQQQQQQQARGGGRHGAAGRGAGREGGDELRLAMHNEEEKEMAFMTEAGVLGDAAAAAQTPLSPPPSAAAATVVPASLSIHKAASTLSARVSASAAAKLSLAEAADDAEVAAILHLPYKLQLPRTPSPGNGVHPSLSPSSPSDAADMLRTQPASLEGGAAAPPTTTTTTATIHTNRSNNINGSAVAFTVTANAAQTAQLLALHEEVNMLRQQLEEQRCAYEEERGARTRESGEEHRRASERTAKYEATIQHLEALHEESMRELVLYRHQTAIQLRDTRGQVEWLRSALQEALAMAEKDRRRQHNSAHATEQRLSRQFYPQVQSLHSELTEHRRASAAQAREHAAAMASKDAQIAELQRRVKAEVQQRHRVEERYRLEMEGVHSELDMMRQSLRQMERRVYYRNARDEATEATETELEHYYQ